MLQHTHKLFLCLALIAPFVFAAKALVCHELSAFGASLSQSKIQQNFTQVFKCEGVSKLLLVPYLWCPTSFSLDCGPLPTVGAAQASAPGTAFKGLTKSVSQLAVSCVHGKHTGGPFRARSGRPGMVYMVVPVGA